jgi:fructosamine-3-kinase
VQSWSLIARQISEVTGSAFNPHAPRPLGGGCINAAWELSDGARRYFVKINAAHRLAMFEAEAAGLRAIGETRSVRVPRPLCWGNDEATAWLVLEYLALGHGGRDRRLGEALAAMHGHCGNSFGFDCDNTIGSTPQVNGYCEDWIEFWRERRLRYQLRLAAANGYGGRLQTLGARLLEALPGFFPGYRPVPSLLHGDLWSGNAAALADGEPVLFDPAVYYGDREADVAMTELFGGFGDGFYQAYRGVWDLDPGYRLRSTLYNLYHILNHLNLFGAGYLRQAEHMHELLLAETGA